MMPNPRLIFVILALVTVGWSAEQDPNRLDQIVVPLAQSIELTLDPAAENYGGRVRIELRVNQQAKRFRLHAKDMTLKQAQLVEPGRTTALHVTVTEARIGIVTAEAPEPIQPGLYTLEMTFENDFERTGTAIYKTLFRTDADGGESAACRGMGDPEL